jgi:hypothetical protein
LRRATEPQSCRATGLQRVEPQSYRAAELRRVELKKLGKTHQGREEKLADSAFAAARV